MPVKQHRADFLEEEQDKKKQYARNQTQQIDVPARKRQQIAPHQI